MTDAHLQQYLCALQRMQTGIPEYSTLTAPLHDFMERVYAVAGKCTRLAVSRVNLSSLGWAKIENDALEKHKMCSFIKSHLRIVTKLSL